MANVAVETVTCIMAYTLVQILQLRGSKKDIQELAQHRFSCNSASTAVEFPDGNENLLNIQVTVIMTSGFYRGGSFIFRLTIPPTYPFYAPEVTCTTRVWHPNINPNNGRVDLPILSIDWRPVLSINTVVLALQLLFLEPNPDHATNYAAAEALTKNPQLFESQVRQTLAGGNFFGFDFCRQISGCEPQTCFAKVPVPYQSTKRKNNCLEMEEMDFTESDSDLKCDMDSMCIQDHRHRHGIGRDVYNVNVKRLCLLGSIERPQPAH